eukprot:NODE_1019_length_1267_cov_334.692244.p1 GENE.NODE_1019_length_1267_cov_334.692244~~NODE_1019_length_1267_cov_334.692244.p1  ORF type:complete len:352 (-),score=71.60 NODE_1019_length_1267_cov_334.692244:212-1153(-)
MAAAAAAFVVLLAGLQQTAGHVHATLISQSVSGPFRGRGSSPAGHMDMNGNMGFFVDVATGAVRTQAEGQIHFRGMTMTMASGMIYDPKTGDTTMWKKSAIGTMRLPSACAIKPAARGYTDEEGGPEKCHGPPVHCIRRFLRSLHYDGEHDGDLFFHTDYNHGGTHAHIRFELNAWARTIAAEHVSMTRGPARMKFHWVVTHTHAGAPGWETFHVPAAWGHCRRMTEFSELEALPEMSTPAMEAVAGIEQSYEMVTELATASSDDASPAYLSACAGFALGALSASMVALAVAALQRRRRVNVAAITEPLANAA